MNNKFRIENLFQSRRGKLSGAYSDKIFGFLNSIFLIFMFIIALYPIIFVLSASISDPQMVNTGKMLLWPVGITWSGYEKLFIYKDPKTDEGGLKKSHKGCCAVQIHPYKDEFVCIDGYGEWVPDDEPLLRTSFADGLLKNVENFHEIRARLYPEVA